MRISYVILATLLALATVAIAPGASAGAKCGDASVQINCTLADGSTCTVYTENCYLTAGTLQCPPETCA